MKKCQKTNNDWQNTTQKTKDWTTQTAYKTRGDLRCPWRASYVHIWNKSRPKRIKFYFVNQKLSKYNQQMYTIKILKKLCGPLLFMFTWNKNQLLAGVVMRENREIFVLLCVIKHI